MDRICIVPGTNKCYEDISPKKGRVISPLPVERDISNTTYALQRYPCHDRWRGKKCEPFLKFLATRILPLEGVAGNLLFFCFSECTVFYTKEIFPTGSVGSWNTNWVNSKSTGIPPTVKKP